MRLESLVLQGFKSFPDKTTVTFDKGLTAVVGPNGSGKSNISDAIRWVLGEQSSKTLRGEKMEDVVFAGSKIRKSQGFAQVTLHLENLDRTLPIDADMVSVSRKYYKQGDSEFAINGKQVRLKDVYELFMDTGLGRDGFSMIGQGRIEEIVSVKSTERRDMFETASGISKFRYHKEEAERDLAKAEDNILRLNDILTEINDRLAPLYKQAQKAKAFLELAKQRETLDVFVSVTDLGQIKTQLDSLNEQIAERQREYNNALKETNLLQFKIEQAYEQMQNDAAAAEDCRIKRAQLEEKVAEAQKQDAVAENEIGRNEREMERLDKEIKEQNALSLMTENKLAEQKNVKAQMVEKLSEHEQLLLAKKEELAEIASKAKERSESLQAMLKEVSEIQLKLTECEVRLHSEQDNVRQDTARKEQLTLLLNEHQDAWKIYSDELRQANKALLVMKEKSGEKDNMIAGMQMRLRKREEKLKEINEAVNNLRLRQKGNEQQLSMLRNMEQNMEGYSGAAKAVLQAVKTRELSGIYGAVAQLISSKEAYTVAVETALGFTLQNIVVANEQTAKDAIRFLQQRNNGRATFMPLTSVKGSRFVPQGIENETGYIGMADELVEYDVKFAGIISFLLGRIVVMDDMENASVTARKYQYKFRIVTLDGQVINAGGTYTGGSRAVSTSSLSRKNKMDTLSREIADLQNQLSVLADQHKKALEQVDQTKFDLQKLLDDKQMLSEDIVRAESECGRLQYTLAQEKQFLSAQQKELSTLQTRMDDKSTLIAELQDAINGYTAEREVRRSAAAATDEEGMMLSNQQDKLAAEISTLSGKQIVMQKDVDVLEMEITRLLSTDTGYKDTVQRKKNEWQLLSNQNDSLIEKRKQLQADILADKAAKEQLAVKEQKLIDRRSKAEKSITEMRIQEKDASILRERSKQETERVKEQLEFKQLAYDEIVRHLFDAYELTKSEAAARDFTGLEYASAKAQLSQVRNKIRELGSVNVSAIEEYEEVNARKQVLDTQLADIESSKKTLLELISNLTAEMEQRFKAGFDAINGHFGRIFTELFGGGNAHLRLTDENDVLNCGIDIFVQPPGKVVKKISLLSGGEKSFIAIILYLALLSVKPSPFCVLDEIEAALDDVNVSRYAQYLHRMGKDTQFILITHRRGTMEQADCMYGVTMQEAGVSKLLKLDGAAMEA